MTIQKINEYEKIKELLKDMSVNVYELGNIQHYVDVLNMLSVVLTEEETNKIEKNKVDIINDYEFLDDHINAEDKDDLMIFLMLAYLSDKDLSKLHRWRIAEYLDNNTLFNIVEEREYFDEALQEIKEY